MDEQGPTKKGFESEDEQFIIETNNELVHELDELTSGIIDGIKEKEEHIDIVQCKIQSAKATLKKIKSRGLKR